MKSNKLIFLVSSLFLILTMLMGCSSGKTQEAEKSAAISHDEQAEAVMPQIKVEDSAHTIIFQLNDSDAAKSLYEQLPLTIAVENYSDDEKIFYPPKKLSTANTPLANAKAGTLAYFAPWGDVVMYYDDFGSYNGLYELGHAVSGEKSISALKGNITISKLEK